ncbi:MAG: hypothetical protein ACYCWW_00310 [Deltaproteobacteria bacterium]
MTEPKRQDPIREALQEVAPSLVGIGAARPVDDELVRDLTHALGRAIDRHIHGTAGRSGSMDPAHREPRPRLHQAIVELLAAIGFPAAPAPAAKAGADHDWLRLPGLFRRWEFEQVIDVDEEFLVEEAGHDEQGLSLFAIYNRPHLGGEGAR